MRRNQYLIANDVERYMAEYEVRNAPSLFSFTRQQEIRLLYYRPAGTPTWLVDSCCCWRIGILHGLQVASTYSLVHTLVTPFPSDEIPVRLD